MNEVLQKISKIGIVPVIKIDNVKDALPLAKALVKGGLPVAEVTFRTACAREAIEIISKEVPDMLVGAGTVLTTEQVDASIAAGAKFIVSPAMNPEVVKHCIAKGIPITPGCSNPSDVDAAVALGLEVVKFFPAEPSGGLTMIKAIAAPYTGVKFIPTGGINAKNLNDYLSYDRILACGGSWMVDAKLINAGEFDKIEALTREAVGVMLGFELAHVGVNAENTAAAGAITEGIAKIFGFPVKEGNTSFFAGTAVEVMKTKHLGDMGHIGFKTNNVDRAVNYLEANGVEFDYSTAKSDGKGLVAVYMKQQLGGFALHLVRKA